MKTKHEQRKFNRYDSQYLLDYVVLDDDGNPGIHSMGRTLDVSIDGLKLETTNPLQPGTRLLITVGIEDDLVDLEGRTTHAHSHEDRYLSGLNFLKISKEGRRVFARNVEAFRQRMKGPQEKPNGATA